MVVSQGCAIELSLYDQFSGRRLQDDICFHAWQIVHDELRGNGSLPTKLFRAHAIGRLVVGEEIANKALKYLLESFARELGKPICSGRRIRKHLTVQEVTDVQQH